MTLSQSDMFTPPTGVGRGNAFIVDCIRRGMHLNEAGEVVSPNGHVHRCGSKVGGYHRINLWAFGESMAVTRAKVICWLAHGGPPTPDAVVDHIDRDRANDAPGNLRWATPSENCLNISPDALTARKKWAREMPRPKGEQHGHSKLTAEQVRSIRQESEQGVSLRVLAKRYPVSKQTLSKIVRRELWSHVA